MIYYVITETETEVALLAILETTWVIHKSIYSPKTRQITVGSVYWPLNQTNFIKTLYENFTKLETANILIEIWFQDKVQYKYQ